jgi:hypothetical protein
MRNTIGFHFVKSCYGQWLPGDNRGHWSEAWDQQIGYIEPHMLHAGDPVRLRMAQERMKHPAVKLDQQMTCAVVDAIGVCIGQSDPPLIITAGAVDFTHLHLAIEYNPRDIDATCTWIADQTTKAVHRATSHHGPVWGKGKWLEFV